MHQLFFVPKVGLEPTQPKRPRDFKSLVSTIPPLRLPWPCLAPQSRPVTFYLAKLDKKF